MYYFADKVHDGRKSFDVWLSAGFEWSEGPRAESLHPSDSFIVSRIEESIE